MKITNEAVEIEVRRLADERPEYVYRSSNHLAFDYSYSCSAEGAGEGHGCIVGQALRALGEDMDAIREWEINCSLPSTGVAELMKDRYGIESSKFLDLVQGFQDSGRAWGWAVDSADEALSQDDNGNSH